MDVRSVKKRKRQVESNDSPRVSSLSEIHESSISTTRNSKDLRTDEERRGRKRKRRQEKIPVECETTSPSRDMAKDKPEVAIDQLSDDTLAMRSLLEGSINDKERSFSDSKSRAVKRKARKDRICQKIPVVEKVGQVNQELLYPSTQAQNNKINDSRNDEVTKKSKSKIQKHAHSKATLGQESVSQTDARTSKMRLAVTKFLKKEGIRVNDFAISLGTVSFEKSAFYDYAKKYFKRSSVKDIERLTKLCVNDTVRAEQPRETTEMSVSMMNAKQDEKNLQDASIGSQHPQEHLKSVTYQSDSALTSIEAAYKEYANSGEPYATGALTSEEQTLLRSKITDYCERNNLSHHDFCDRVHDLPAPLSRNQKRSMYSQFVYLFPNRKAKGIRDHIRRAYAPHERTQFTQEDDAEILRLHMEKGADWRAIGTAMGRFKEDVRDRYRNYLIQPMVTSGEWTPEENKKFHEILNNYNDKKEIVWSTIAEQMGTRTRQQCRDRFIRIQGGRTQSRGEPQMAFQDLSLTKLGPNRSTKSNNVSASVSLPPHGTIEPEKPDHGLEQSSHVAAPKKKSSTRKKQRNSSKILLGDVLHLLSILRKSKAKSLSEAMERNVFRIYDGVFSMIHIKDRLEKELNTGTQPFVSRLRKLIAEMTSLSAKELKRTLVDESDVE